MPNTIPDVKKWGQLFLKHSQLPENIINVPFLQEILITDLHNPCGTIEDWKHWNTIAKMNKFIFPWNLHFIRQYAKNPMWDRWVKEAYQEQKKVEPFPPLPYEVIEKHTRWTNFCSFECHQYCQLLCEGKHLPRCDICECEDNNFCVHALDAYNYFIRELYPLY